MDLFLFIKIFTTILFTSSIVSWNVLWNQCRYMATTFAMEELPTTWIYGLKHKNLYVLMNVVVIKLFIVVFYSILLNNFTFVYSITSPCIHFEPLWDCGDNRSKYSGDNFIGLFSFDDLLLLKTTLWITTFQALLKGIFSWVCFPPFAGKHRSRTVRNPFYIELLNIDSLTFKLMSLLYFFDINTVSLCIKRRILWRWYCCFSLPLWR